MSEQENKLTRREFIKQGAVAGAAALTLGPLALAKGLAGTPEAPKSAAIGTALTGRLKADFSKILQPISRNIYGHFAEHMHQDVYMGLWIGENSELAPSVPNLRGWRKDVLEMVQALQPPVIRWPGGCFSEHYHWEDGLGPREKRLNRFNRAWSEIEPNMVGTHEFMDFCQLVGAQPMFAANVRTGSTEEAAAWVEYCNGSVATTQGKRRAANGHPAPFNVRYWCIGNETWDAGAEPSAQKHVAFSRAMKAVDPNIKVTAVSGYPLNLAEWNSAMLNIAGKELDYLAPHHYDGLVVKPGKDEAELHYGNQLIARRFAGSVAATIAQIEKAMPNRPEVAVSLDEWGIWVEDDPDFNQNYCLSDALLAAGTFNSFQRLGPRLQIACWAQLVNVLGLIRARQNRAWPTAVYEVFRLYTNLCGDHLAQAQVDCPSVNARVGQGSSGGPSINDALPLLDVSATISPGNGQAAIVMVNRAYAEKLTVKLEIAGLEKGKGAISLHTLDGPSVTSRKSPQQPATTVKVSSETLADLPTELVLPPHSLTVLSVGGSLTRRSSP